MRINHHHLSPDDIAELAEGRAGDSSAMAWREHFSECRSCFAAYNDAVRYRAAFLASPESFQPTRRLIDEGVAVRSMGSGSRPRRTKSSGIQFKLGIAAALVVVLAGGLWVLTPPAGDSQRRSVQVDARLHRLIGEVSARGLILPGGEDFATLDPVTFRAGGSPVDADVDQSLKKMMERSRNGALSVAEEAGLVSSLLAADRIAEAFVINEAARQRYPGDARFVHLAAIIAHRRNDVGNAEELLRSVIEMDPRGGTARLNLGILLREEGREEADLLFKGVVEDFPDTPLAIRARREQESEH